MEIKKEIQRIAEYQNALLPRHSRKSEQAIKDIVNMAIKSYTNESYDFSKYIRLQLRQAEKHRTVMMYTSFSAEELLCIYLKRLLDRKFHVSYPNRNTYVRSLFDTICVLKDMSDYTIFKFDFKDFFNSISSAYVYTKYMQRANLERYQMKLLEKFVFTTQYAYAGLNTSNIICEIIAKQFDELLIQRLSPYGVILYKRYIDDGVVIFNRYISKNICLDLVNNVIAEIFQTPLTNVSPCNISLNSRKTKYIARRFLSIDGAQKFDFLGYEFNLSVKKYTKSEKTVFQYGITQKKIEKYTKQIENIVKSYNDDPQKDIELLRHKIKAFTHRTVYRINRYKSIVWKSKGFVSNYCELRYRMDDLTPKTKKFLMSVVNKAFTNNGTKLPYFLNGNKDQSVYSLYNNMKNYRTLLFVEQIGIDKISLNKLCKQINIDTSTGKGYDGLVRDYLIKVKVGH